MKTFKVIILLGKSACGKGTQAKLLQKKFDLAYLGSGDLLRKRAEKKDYTGKKISEIFQKGGLIPTPVILKLWLEKVEELKSKKNLKGIIMDGNPRKILESYLIDETFAFYQWQENVQVVLIDISNQEATNRIVTRKRADDSPESIKKRLAWFQKDVQPIINYYKKRGILTKINGEQKIEKVFQDILTCLR